MLRGLHHSRVPPEQPEKFCQSPALPRRLIARQPKQRLADRPPAKAAPARFAPPGSGWQQQRRQPAAGALPAGARGMRASLAAGAPLLHSAGHAGAGFGVWDLGFRVSRGGHVGAEVRPGPDPPPPAPPQQARPPSAARPPARARASARRTGHAGARSLAEARRGGWGQAPTAVTGSKWSK